MPVQIMSGKAFCLVAERASERERERAHRLRKRPPLSPFLLSSCIKSAFSRRHDGRPSDWTVDQVKVIISEVLKLGKVKLEIVSKQV